MNDTKENILITALKLFASDGYEAVSVSKISGELGITKGALYKHYKNKRDIFDSIVERMRTMTNEKALESGMPQGTIKDAANYFNNTSLQKIYYYSMSQFIYWTENEFSTLFRRLVTLEQYRNKEISELYQNYIVSGPLNFMEELFAEMTGNKDDAIQLALEFYAPIYFLYSLYDGGTNKEELLIILNNHIERFSKTLESKK